GATRSRAPGWRRSARFRRRCARAGRPRARGTPRRWRLRRGAGSSCVPRVAWSSATDGRAARADRATEGREVTAGPVVARRAARVLDGADLRARPDPDPGLGPVRAHRQGEPGPADRRPRTARHDLRPVRAGGGGEHGRLPGAPDARADGLDAGAARAVAARAGADRPGDRACAGALPARGATAPAST